MPSVSVLHYGLIHRWKWLIPGLFAWFSGQACAVMPSFWSSGFRVLSEIIVPLGGSSKGSSSSNASEPRKKARAALEKTENPTVEGVIVELEEPEGILSRARVGVPTDNRAKALNYLNGSEGGRVQMVRPPIEAAPGTIEATRSNLERNRDKAHRYSEDGSSAAGKTGTFVKIGTEVGVVGSDGVIVVTCESTNNTAGRIGDDTQSGNYFSVVVNGKLAKARCK
jgi:hypothetical protein